MCVQFGLGWGSVEEAESREKQKVQRGYKALSCNACILSSWILQDKKAQSCHSTPHSQLLSPIQPFSYDPLFYTFHSPKTILLLATQLTNTLLPLSFPLLSFCFRLSFFEHGQIGTWSLSGGSPTVWLATTRRCTKRSLKTFSQMTPSKLAPTHLWFFFYHFSSFFLYLFCPNPLFSSVLHNSSSHGQHPKKWPKRQCSMAERWAQAHSPAYVALRAKDYTKREKRLLDKQACGICSGLACLLFLSYFAIL